MILIVVDTTQIQPYIFGSNRLQENIGASFLVSKATGEWALSALPKPNNVLDAARGKLSDEVTLLPPKNDPTAQAKDGLIAEALYAGGGNVVALFKGPDEANKFERTLSRRVLEEAPNLQLVMARSQFSPGQPLVEAVRAAFHSLGKEKQSREQIAPTWGLGVTRMCRSTGLPAVDIVEIAPNDQYPASAEIHAKINAVRAANRRLDSYLDINSEPLRNYKFPYDFDNLGRSAGEDSHIAIVHADGNGMGKRVQAITEQYATAADNREYVLALRNFSRNIEEAGQTAMRATLKRLTNALSRFGGDKIHHYNAFGKRLAEVVLQRVPDEPQSKFYLPFRPIVFGGDDITFVCDGRIGLSLALAYLRAFEEATADIMGPEHKLTACAGVSIVKSHYPFAQAYDLAEALIKSAKQYRQQQKSIGGEAGAYLDWHFALTGLSGPLDHIREREYTVEEGYLTLRPVSLDENSSNRHRGWPVVWRGLQAFQDASRSADQSEPDWSTRRNKMKALREELRRGSTAVSRFLVRYNEREPLPDVASGYTNWRKVGWQNGFCGYFDALELADWYIPLEEDQTNGTRTASDVTQ